MGNLELILLAFGLLLYTPVTAAALANLLFWTSHKRPAPATSSSVTILIPARNEENTLRECVNSALAQGNSVSEILVYNDHSTDGTQQVLDEIIAANPGRVRQIAAHDLPADWAGKPHACHRLSEAVNSRWMLFVDADSQLMPGAVDLLLANAEQRSATMLSAWPRIEMKSFSERLFMPLLNFVVFSLFPAPIARVRRTPSLGLAHGVCILAESETYRRLGGHSLVKNELFEDTSLARAWRAAGENSQVIDGRNIVTVRMYTNFVGIWNGFSKNYYPAFGSFASFAAFQLHMAISSVLLPLGLTALVVVGQLPVSWLAVASASLLPRALIALRFRHPVWSVLLHPFQVIVMIALGIWSWWLVEHGRGVSWKGRRYEGSELRVSHE